MKNVVLFLFLMSPCLNAFAQEKINLKNPSFELDQVGAAQVPSYWENLGETKESPPDIQPGSFGVKMKAQNGDQYVGMVVRDNNTWEGIGQPLDSPLRKDSAYTFSLYLARSNTYSSVSRMTQQEVNYNAPTILKIWGYNRQTQQDEVLAESTAISHSQWTRYTFILKPTVADFDELDLMAYYAKGYEKMNGNLLIDNCSAILKM